MANSKPKLPTAEGSKAALDYKLFECPVCFQIPEAEIYQCKNGHSTCGPCAESVDQCPQCREPWVDNNGKIRNLSMEVVIAEMEVCCRNKGYGCEIRVPRKELAAHVENHCKFNPIYLCKIMGLTSCNFASGPQVDISRHFVEQHKVSVQELWRTNSKMESYFKTSIINTLRDMKTGEGTQEVTPIAVQHKGSLWRILICLYINNNNNNNNVAQREFSVSCLRLDEDGQRPQPEVTIEIHAVKKNVRWSWSGPALSYKRAENTLRNPPFTICMPYLLEVLGNDEELTLEVTFSSRS